MSRMSRWIDSLAAAASSVATRAAERAAGSTGSSAAAKATAAANKAAADVRRSMAKAQIDAKGAGERWAREARRSAARIGEDAMRSAERTARRTGERATDSMAGATLSAKKWIRDETSRRMPRMPKLPFASESAATSPPSSKPPPTPLPPGGKIADALPSKETLLRSASAIAGDAVSKTTANVTSQVSETVQKTTRWLWWWGLAAVAVYGMTTTLTKEGVQMLKDFASSPRKSIAEVADSAVATPVDDDASAAGMGDGASGSGRGGGGGRVGSGWLSWFSRQTDEADGGREG